VVAQVRRESYTMTIKVVSAAKKTQDHKFGCSTLIDDYQGGTPPRQAK
jgi:hypothetical protein